MADKKEFIKRLDYLLGGGGDRYVKKLPVGGGRKYAVISDLHIGDGSGADNFRQNEKVLCKALGYYQNNDYEVILLGDIEEFHQFQLFSILDKYNDSVYAFLRNFGEARVHRVFGNHDPDWALEDPLYDVPDLKCCELIQLGPEIILTHGHQARESYEKDLQVVRFGTTFYKFVEKFLGSSDPFTVMMVPDGKDVIYADWSRETKKIFICGHTHTPVFASKTMYDWIDVKLVRIESALARATEDTAKDLKELKRLLKAKKARMAELIRDQWLTIRQLSAPGYFNSGGGIFSDGITTLEIEGPLIRLVYWNNVFQKREPVWGDQDMNEILNGLKGTTGKTYIQA
jgi:predicted phosphodiesterase